MLKFMEEQPGAPSGLKFGKCIAIMGTSEPTSDPTAQPTPDPTAQLTASDLSAASADLSAASADRFLSSAPITGAIEGYAKITCSDGKLSTGAIVGIVIGVLVGLALIAGGLCCLKRRKNTPSGEGGYAPMQSNVA